MLGHYHDAISVSSLCGQDQQTAGAGSSLTQDACALQSEIANRRAQQNTFVRQLADMSRTLKSMGMYHLVQVTLLSQPSVQPSTPTITSWSYNACS